MKNPKWTIDEVLLGVNCYFEIGNVRLASPAHEKVIALSKLLNKLPIHKKRGETFRNPTGVAIVLKNIACSDEKAIYSLRSSTKLGQQVFMYHKKDRLALSNIAYAITQCLPLPYEYRAPEKVKSFKYGNILFSYHLYLENIIKRDKKNLSTVCTLCLRDLSILYGDKAGSIIQKHCLIQPEFYSNEMKVDDDDFCTICPNCHDFLHIDFEVFSITQIKELAGNKYV